MDAKCLIDRFDGESWDESVFEPEEVNIDIDDNMLVDHNGGSPSSLSGNTSPAVDRTQSNMNSLLVVRSQSDSVISTTPHGSVCGSATLQLAFPDPLTSSNEDIFPTASQTTSFPELNVHCTKSQTPHVVQSAIQESAVNTESLFPDMSLIPPGYEVEDFAEAIVLLGKPSPLKASVMERIMATKANFLNGSSSVVYNNGVSIGYEIQMNTSQEACSKILILIVDVTPQVDMRLILKSLNCPVLALTFDRVQFFRPAKISKNVAHFILLPPSESMVDSSVVDISISDSMRYFPDNIYSLSPKSSLNVSNEQHLEDSFGHSQSIPLHDFLALSNEAMAKTLNLPTLYSDLGTFPHSGATPSTPFHVSFRAFFFCFPLVLTLAMFMWGNLVQFWRVDSNIIIPSKHVTPMDQLADVKGVMAISPLKSLAVSVFRPQSNSARPQSSNTAQCRLSRSFTPTLPDPRPKHLTLDPPATKSLELVPSGRARSMKSPLALPHVAQTFNALAIRFTTALSPVVTAIEQDINELLEAIDALLDAIARLQDAATRKVGHGVDMAHALSRQVITEIINWSKQTSLSQISKQTSYRAQKLPKYASQSMHAFTNKMYDAALTVGKHAAHRHSRARQNARKVRNRVENGVRRIEQVFHKAKDSKLEDVFLL